MMRGLKYPTFSRTALDKWEWQEDAVDVASISIQNSDFRSLIKPEPLWPAECNHTVWNEWNLSKHMSEAGTDQCHLELIETTQTPLQRKISILVGGTELLLLQRKLNLPNIIRGKEYIYALFLQQSSGLKRKTLVVYLCELQCHWCSLNGRFLFIWYFQLFVPETEAPWETCGGWMHSS